MRSTATWASSLLVVLSACGGGGGAAGDPARTTPVSARQDDAAKPASSEESEAPSAPRKPSCSDGSCFTCGDAICPTGFYCETGRAGSGCAWASTCTDRPTCACLGGAVKGCDCRDEGGVARVSCR